MKSPCKILIVDDEPDIAMILKLHLEDTGYVTVWAKGGEAALSMLSDDEYSLVLLDIKMPGISGVEVLWRIKETGNAVGVIMMTAHGNENLAVQCMKAGALDYFPKPFDLDDVIQRVERAITYLRILQEKQRLEQEKEDFVSMLSHDMKNPLAAVIGSIDIMREGRLGPVNEEQVEFLQAAIESCNEVVAMIDNLLDIHRFEAGKMQMMLRTCNPADIVTSATTRFNWLAGQEGISLTVKLGDDLPEIAIDRNALTRIIANLLSNAIKFTPAGGKITVICQSINGKDLEKMDIPGYAGAPQQLFSCRKLLCLSVIDTGTGIPSEDQGRIFERFIQSRRNNRERGGTGLGLAYCKLATESLGGIIWVKSEGNTGSEFIILLPVQDLPIVDVKGQ